MATDIIARGMITEYIAGTNINFTENRDGTVEISASGSISSEDSVARDAIGNHKSDTSNPHNVTPAQIGLGNVDNTSDLDKPISTAVKQAIDNKADKTVATSSADGLMSAEDKSKLDDADNTYALKSKYGDTTINLGRRVDAPIGDYSTSLGIGTVANGYASTAEGAGSQASELASHAGGYNSQAIKKCSFAHGYEVDANHDYETAFGKHNISNDDTLFSIGNGAEINTDGNISIARHNAFEITTTGGKLHDKDIAVKDDIINPNLLINPDFKINQRGVSGTFSETGKYFVDRWRLASGAITINADGTLTLNGTISQIFENAVGDNVIASVSAGAAVYDNSTKTFSITANGEIISWAKLEYGSNATQFIPPDTATELLKCMRYYEKIVCSSDMYTVACQYFNNLADCAFTIPMMPKRVTSPTSTIDYSAMSYQNSENTVNVSSARAVAYSNNSVSIVAGLLSPTTVCTHGWVTGFMIEIDAEIY